MNRQSRKKVKELELESKQIAAVADKEVELLNRKYNKLVESQDAIFDRELDSTMAKMQQRKDCKPE